MNEKKAVIFDLDGTLLDTLDDLANATNHILKTHGYPLRSRKEIRSFLGNGAADLIRHALPDTVGQETFEACLAEYLPYYQAHSRVMTKPYDGIPDVLAELKKLGIQAAVVSNKPDATTRDLCKEYFGGLLSFSVGDRADLARKPSADPVLYAMKGMGCDEAVFVGDSEVDVLTAKNAKLSCVSVTWGFRDRDFLEEQGANCFADTSEELLQHLLRLLNVERKEEKL